MKKHKALITKILSFSISVAMVSTILPNFVLATEGSALEGETIVGTENEFLEDSNEIFDDAQIENGDTNDADFIVKLTTHDEVLKSSNPFNISEGNLTISETDSCSEENPHVVTGKTTTNVIVVKSGIHYIELKDVDISITDMKSAIEIKADATVYLTLHGTNKLEGGQRKAGIEVPTDATLNIDGTGSLEAIGGTYLAYDLGGAGIGGSAYVSSGTININGGTITTIGGWNAAAIGGGVGAQGGVVNINGGNVIAIGGAHAAVGDGGGAGIGGGYNQSGAKVAISNNAEVIAISEQVGKAISNTDNTIVPDTGTVANIMQLNFKSAIGKNSKIEITDENGYSLYPSISNESIPDGVNYDYFKSFAISIKDAGTYTVFQNGIQLKHELDGSKDEKFNVISGVNQYNKIENARTLDSIYVSPTPKEEWIVGEYFDTAGMTIQADFIGGITIDLTDYTIWIVPEGADPNNGKIMNRPLVKGDTVYIRYTEGGVYSEAKVVYGISNPIIVVDEPTLSCIEVTTQPLKTKYKVGESFDPSGMVVTATYEDGRKSIRTNYMISPSGALTTADNQVTISYKVKEITKDATVGITVMDSTPVTPPPIKPSVEDAVTQSGAKVDIDVVKTSNEVKEVIGKENTITTIKIEKINEPVVVSVNVGRKLAEKHIYAVQFNPETMVLELVAVANVDKKGNAQFTTSSATEITIASSLPVGFISTASSADTQSAIYYMTENNEFQKGWLETDTSDYYFFDYDNATLQVDKWVADGNDVEGAPNWYSLSSNGLMHKATWIANDASGSRWYFVDANGLCLRNTIVDGYVINEEGYWSE